MHSLAVSLVDEDILGVAVPQNHHMPHGELHSGAACKHRACLWPLRGVGEPLYEPPVEARPVRITHQSAVLRDEPHQLEHVDLLQLRCLADVSVLHGRVFFGGEVAVGLGQQVVTETVCVVHPLQQAAFLVEACQAEGAQP